MKWHKNLRHNYVSPTDFHNKTKLVKYHLKLNTTNLVIYNNFFPLTLYLSMINIMYQFKCSFREYFSNEMSTYICLTHPTDIYFST